MQVSELRDAKPLLLTDAGDAWDGPAEKVITMPVTSASICTVLSARVRSGAGSPPSRLPTDSGEYSVT